MVSRTMIAYALATIRWKRKSAGKKLPPLWCMVEAGGTDGSNSANHLLDCYKDADELLEVLKPPPVPMRLHCPDCHALHIDEGEFAKKPHHTHACQHCGNVWRPAVEPTFGVRFLPGFKNEVKP